MITPVYHFISEEESLERRLADRLANCNTSILASAFFTFGGWRALKSALVSGLENGAQVTFLLGRFDFVTEPNAVDEAIALSKQFKGLQVYFDADFGFHYKLAVFRTAAKRVVIIGSSNLTRKGLSAIGEDNLEILGNYGVYRQALELLERRLKNAVPAENEIESYRQKYNRAKKYRRQRSNWQNRGQKAWHTRRKRRVYTELGNQSFPLCWFDQVEDDETLKRYIEKEHKKAQATGDSFPNQWVHLEGRYGRPFKEDELMVVCDGLSHNIGFAICTRKFNLLDKKEKRQPVVFFRYKRGWKAHCTSESKFNDVIKKIGLTDRLTVGMTVAKRLKTYLRKRRR